MSTYSIFPNDTLFVLLAFLLQNSFCFFGKNFHLFGQDIGNSYQITTQLKTLQIVKVSMQIIMILNYEMMKLKHTLGGAVIHVIHKSLVNSVLPTTRWHLVCSDNKAVFLNAWIKRIQSEGIWWTYNTCLEHLLNIVSFFKFLAAFASEQKYSYNKFLQTYPFILSRNLYCVI